MAEERIAFDAGIQQHVGVMSNLRWNLVGAALVSLFSLASGTSAQAQGFRSRSQSESKGRPEWSPHHHEEARGREIGYHLQALTNTTAVLHQSFARHCAERRLAADSPDMEVSRALGQLREDAQHLSEDILDRSGKQDLRHIYRSFHMLEYAFQDALVAADDAGYSRSLSAYMRDIDEHMDELGDAGFRNPRVKRMDVDRFYRGARSDQERHVMLPPVPSQPQPPAPPPGPGGESRRSGGGVDLGELLGRLFGRRDR